MFRKRFLSMLAVWAALLSISPLSPANAGNEDWLPLDPIIPANNPIVVVSGSPSGHSGTAGAAPWGNAAQGGAGGLWPGNPSGGVWSRSCYKPKWRWVGSGSPPSSVSFSWVLPINADYAITGQPTTFGVTVWAGVIFTTSPETGLTAPSSPPGSNWAGFIRMNTYGQLSDSLSTSKSGTFPLVASTDPSDPPNTYVSQYWITVQSVSGANVTKGYPPLVDPGFTTVAQGVLTINAP